jgi:hypothetical protein
VSTPTLLSRPGSPLPHSISQALSVMAPISMDLSEQEQTVVWKMRDAVQAEVSRLMMSLDEADQFQDHLTSNNRYLEAWIGDLIAALELHGIAIPEAPTLQ